MKEIRTRRVGVKLALAITFAVITACTTNSIERPASSQLMNLAYGPDKLQAMDVYLPKQPRGPVILMVHGGAWMIGDKGERAVIENKAARWLPEGIILVSVNYRLSPRVDPLEQVNDVAKALAFAQEHAAAWGGDPSQFVLMGHSAGAHLVALLAADPSIAASQGARLWLGSVILDSAALDLVQLMESPHMRFYDQVFKDERDYWRKASPAHRITGTGAPMLIVCSKKREDACPQAHDFAAQAGARGRRIKVLTIGLSHRGINKELGREGGYTEAVEAFLRTLCVETDLHLVHPPA